MFEQDVTSFAVTSAPGGPMIAAIYNGGRFIGVYEQSGRFLFGIPTPDEYYSAFTSIAWSHDGRYLTGGTRLCQVFVWDVQRRALLSIYRGHYGKINCVSWFPDGAYIASTSSDQGMQVWAPGTGNQLFPPRLLKTESHEVVWSPDGAYLVTCGDKMVRVWKAHTGRCLYTYRGHSAVVISLAWSLDGTHIISGSLDGTAQIWRIPRGWQCWRMLFGARGVRLFTLLAQRPHDTIVLVRWSPEGTVLAAMTETDLLLWEVTTARPLAAFSADHMRTFAWLPCGTRIAVATDSASSIWRWRV